MAFWPMAPSFAQLMASYPWREIPGCLGRYRLVDPVPRSIEELLGGRASAERFQTVAARDPVWVIKFEDGGGLISYERCGGTFVHTLNTAAGLERKLAQLGIDLEGGLG